jgi:DNA-binding NarL/FixJ family response regulator
VEQASETPGRGKTLSVVIAEASSMDCQLLVDAMERQCRINIVGCFLSSTAAAAAIREAEPDVALISARLQDGIYAGLSAASSLQSSRVRSRIVMLVDSEERELVVECFRVGGRGIFNRAGSIKALCKCINRVHEGQIWASSAAIGYVLETLEESPRLNTNKPKNIQVLSKREQEVVGLVLAGCVNREIAARLKLNEHTVGNYLSHIFEKLGVSSRIELVLRCLNQKTADEGGGAPGSVSKFGT